MLHLAARSGSEGRWPMTAISQQVYKLNLHLRYGPVVIGDVLYPPGGVFGPRIQRDYQLVVIHRGSLRLKLDAQWIEEAQHTGILLSPHPRATFSFPPDP